MVMYLTVDQIELVQLQQKALNGHLSALFLGLILKILVVVANTNIL